jgi:thioredoxin
MATVKLTKDLFRSDIFDYESENEWKYKGKLPAIVDFYADWCGPCKAIAPALEQLSEEFEGQLIIYKLDTDAEQELSAAFGIQSIPTLLFIPMGGNPMLNAGAVPKNVLKQVITERLLVNKDTPAE